MAHEVRRQISMLVKLQDLELEIARIQQTLSQVNRRTAELDAQLQGFVSSVEAGKLCIQELTQSIRARESDLQLNQGRIEKSQEKLRAVKTNKEYQSGLKEIEDLGAIGSKIEDEILVAMEQMEAATATLKENQARMDVQADVIHAEKESVLQQAQQDRLRLERVEAEAAAAASRITADVLTLYRRVKAKKANGVAICAVCASVCRGCNMNIPPQMYNELQRVDRLKICPNCERIIYWDDDQSRSE